MEKFYAIKIAEKVIKEYEPDLIKMGLIPIPSATLKLSFFDTLKMMFRRFEYFERFYFQTIDVEQMEEQLSNDKVLIEEHFEFFSNYNLKDEIRDYILKCEDLGKIKTLLNYVSEEIDSLKFQKTVMRVEHYTKNEYHGHFYSKVSVSDSLLEMIETLDYYLINAINEGEDIVKLYAEQPTPEPKPTNVPELIKLNDKKPTKKDLLLYYDFTKEKEQFDNDTQFYEEITKKYGYSKQGMKNAKGELNDKIYLTDKDNLSRLMKLMEGKDDALKNLNEFLKLNRIA